MLDCDSWPLRTLPFLPFDFGFILSFTLVLKKPESFPHPIFIIENLAGDVAKFTKKVLHITFREVSLMKRLGTVLLFITLKKTWICRPFNIDPLAALRDSQLPHGSS